MNVKCSGITFELDKALSHGMIIDDDCKDAVISELYSRSEMSDHYEDRCTELADNIESLKQYLDSPELLDIDEKIDELNDSLDEYIRDDCPVEDAVCKHTCDITVLILDALKEKLDE